MSSEASRDQPLGVCQSVRWRTRIGVSLRRDRNDYRARHGCARYKQTGKIVFFCLSAPITTNGTCASSIQASLPFTSTNTANQNGIGREDGVSGKTLAARIANNSTTLVITNYDNTYPGVNSAILDVSGFYETP
jgi:hypothetical protein